MPPSHKSYDTLRKPSLASTAIQMPSIAVTPSAVTEGGNNENTEMFQKPTIKVGPTVHSDSRRKSADPIEPIYSNM